MSENTLALRVHETITLTKIDKSGEEPRVLETITLRDGERVEHVPVTEEEQ